MTRETKIGLLVGLAFIIVIGILLSDYKTAANEPVQAALQTTGNSVRSGVGSPTDDNVSPVAVVPPEVTPKQIVPTRDELTPKPVQPPITVARGESTAGVPIALAQEGDKGGEPIVAIGNTPAKPVVDQPAHTSVRTYVAVDGDSLSKIALKTLGTKSKAARTAIIALNKSLQANPNLIVVGHTYTVPAVNAAATTVQSLPIEPAQKPATVVAVAQPQYTYTVKAGDSLWSIANDELGNSAAIPAIKAINKDVLRGSDQVRVNMKLKLPAKPVADAS